MQSSGHRTYHIDQPHGGLPQRLLTHAVTSSTRSNLLLLLGWAQLKRCRTICSNAEASTASLRALYHREGCQQELCAHFPANVPPCLCPVVSWPYADRADQAKPSR
jgi:hypothetical protein